jgi:RND family efflux transporter MFP subunit
VPPQPTISRPCNSATAQGQGIAVQPPGEGRSSLCPIRGIARRSCADARAGGAIGLRVLFPVLPIVVIACLSAVVRAQGAGDTMPPLADTAEIRAQLTARNYTTLSSEASGRIDRISTRVGERFKKGDALIVFDCVTQRAQMARAKAVATQAEKTAAINQRLANLKSIGELELDISRAEVEKAKADLAIAEAAASKCVIAAPFNGITVEQKAQEFQYATPGQPLLEILDDRSLEVELIAPSRWLAWLKPGYVFQVHIDETDKTYPAEITRVGGRVDPVSQTIKVFGEVRGDVADLIAGMSGRANIPPPK